jgi:hypothetical protein
MQEADSDEDSCPCCIEKMTNFEQSREFGKELDQVNKKKIRLQKRILEELPPLLPLQSPPDLESLTQQQNAELTRSQRRRRNRKQRLGQEATEHDFARMSLNETENVVDKNDNDHLRVFDKMEKLQVVLCQKLATFETRAINAKNKDDYCASCLQQWAKFEDPTIAAILECNHATCVSCLFRFHKESFCGNDDAPEFRCVLCRRNLSPLILDDIAQQVVKTS